MNRHPLLAHPSAPPAADWQLEAEARVIPGGLGLRFLLEGEARRLRLGSGRGRAHELWRQTCFEAFLAPEGKPGYLEFNVTPSGAWAAYGFDARRQGMRPLELPQPPEIATNRGDRSLEVTVQFLLPFAAPAWRLGLAAVLEEVEGTMSYWALAHPGPLPDFHDPAGFLLDIAAA
jgi:hypothetical protein